MMLNEISIKREDLLRILRENREAHLKEYQEAIVAFRPKYLERLEAMLRAATDGDTFDKTVQLTIPTQHERDYDQAIRMLELGAHETVTIDEHTFRQFVMDDWAWKDTFSSTNKLYRD